MDMSDLIKCVYDYRNLLGRKELLRMRLDAAELQRLEGMERLLEWRPDEGGGLASMPLSLRRRFSRFDLRAPATVKVGALTQPVVLVNLGAGGAVVEPAPTLRRGELSVLKLLCTSLGREFHFPVQAKWQSESSIVPGRRSAMGLIFVGVPIELRFGVGRSSVIADAA